MCGWYASRVTTPMFFVEGPEGPLTCLLGAAPPPEGEAPSNVDLVMPVSVFTLNLKVDDYLLTACALRPFFVAAKLVCLFLSSNSTRACSC